jgi:hypothetical protein
LCFSFGARKSCTHRNPNPLSQSPPSLSSRSLHPSQDGTLVLHRLSPSGPSFGPASPSDWRFFNPDVPAKLQALVEDGYEIVVLR